MTARGSLLPAALLLLGLILYLPTLRIGFLTDDFLDIQTDLSNAGEAFTGMVSSGYRPLMSYSWALDNAVWGLERPWGWHLTNLIILALALVSLNSFLRLFVSKGTAIAAGLAVFAFSTPVLVSVAKMDWRTSILPIIPLLWSLYLCIRYSRGGGGEPILRHRLCCFSSQCSSRKRPWPRLPPLLCWHGPNPRRSGEG